MRIKGGLYTGEYWNADVTNSADISPSASSVTLSAYNDKIIVKEGDWVSIGDPLTKHMKAHASVSGRVISAKHNRIIIENDNNYNRSISVRPFNKRLSDASFDDISGHIAKLGIMSNGQLLYDDILTQKGSAKILLVSCSDTAPYISYEHINMSSNSTSLVYGAKIIAKSLGVTNVVFCIQKRYKNAYNEFILNIEKQKNMSVLIHSSKYPADKNVFLSKQFAAQNRKLKAKFKLDDFFYIKGSVCTEVFEGFKTGCPTVKKNIIITGPAATNPCYVNVPVGTSIKEILELTGNTISEKTSLTLDNSISGTAATVDSAIGKENSTILMSEAQDIISNTSCVSCISCHKACPINLYPMVFLEGKAADLHKCIECGCCSYVCPSKIDILSHILNLKQEKEKNKNAQ